MIVFDPNQIRNARARAHPRFDQHDFLINYVWDKLIDRVVDIRRAFSDPVILGSRGANRANQILLDQKKITTPATILDDHAGYETLPLPAQSADLILSVFDLHTINDLPGFLVQIRQALRPDGVFMAAFPGDQTLHELRSAMMHAEIILCDGASPHINPMIDLHQMAALMQRGGFALPVVDNDVITVDYTSLTKLLYDLRYMGEGNAIAGRAKRFLPRAFFAHVNDYYHQSFSKGSPHLPATFDIFYAIGWAPHKDQPQPLKPGTATVRLADALNTQKEKAGDTHRPE